MGNIVHAPSPSGLAMWRTIETAPKDGTNVLVAIAGLPRSSGEAFWRDAEQHSAGGFWMTWDGENHVRTAYTTPPTHWMPIPEPPSSDERSVAAHGTARHPNPPNTTPYPSKVGWGGRRTAVTETKEFPTEDVLSSVTGYLATDRGIGAVYDVLGWMTDGPVWTHQLPRIGREAAPVVLKAHPALEEAYAEAGNINPDNWQEYVERWRNRYGPTIAVPRMSADEHERIDPLSELAEKVHPDRIIVVEALQ